jgi:hypothetical protein
MVKAFLSQELSQEKWFDWIQLLKAGAMVSIHGISFSIISCFNVLEKLQANTFALIKASPHRVDVRCPHFASCGACQFLHISYAEQLRMKKQFVRDCAHEDDWSVISDCAPSPSSASTEKEMPAFYYRNKVTLVAFREEIRDERGAVCDRKARTKVGYFHRDDSRNFVQIDSCIVASPEINLFLKHVNDLIRESGIEAPIPSVEKARKRRIRMTEKGLFGPHEDSANSQSMKRKFISEGSLRHIIVRSTVFGKKLHIIIVTNGEKVEERGISLFAICLRFSNTKRN